MFRFVIVVIFAFLFRLFDEDIIQINNQRLDSRISYSGNVILFNEAGQELEDKSNVIIILTGEKEKLKGFTDKKGYFFIKNIMPGKYRVQFSKAGYGTYQSMEYNMSNGPIVNFGIKYKLGALSNTIVSNLDVEVNENSFNIKGKINPAGTKKQPRQRQYFFGKTASVSKDNYLCSISSLGTTDEKILENIPFEVLKENGFKSGENVFFVAHGNNTKALSYIDPETKIKVYPALNPKSSNVVSFKLP